VEGPIHGRIDPLGDAGRQPCISFSWSFDMPPTVIVLAKELRINPASVLAAVDQLAREQNRTRFEIVQACKISQNAKAVVARMAKHAQV
jgi:hypothetical protein